ncbi:MAG TPA: hypothetical protein VM537_17485 [Anaerolineae bacterium]|nr:hypothetical protein [Anaerolineae bacterium]
MTLNTIAPADLALYNRAQARLAAAQELSRFVGDHLSAVYQLGPADKVDLTTGDILRSPTSEEPEAPAVEEAE